MPERLACEVLQTERYINTLTFTFIVLLEFTFSERYLVNSPPLKSFFSPSVSDTLEL